MNQCNFIGRLGQDPEVRYSQAGKPIASISLAISEKYKDAQGNRQERTTWVRCTAFNQVAELIQQYVHKGDQLSVTCKYDTQEYQDKNTGEKKYSHSFIINEMRFIGRKSDNQGNQNTGQYPQAYAAQAPSQRNNAPQTTASVGNSLPPSYASDDFDDDVPF